MSRRSRLSNDQRKTRLIKSLPASLRTCVADSGWKIVSPRNQSCWKVINEEEYFEEFSISNFIDTFKAMANNTSLYLTRFGLKEDNANTFMTLLNGDTMEKLHSHLSEQLVKDDKAPILGTFLFKVISE